MSRATDISDDAILKAQLADWLMPTVKYLMGQWDIDHKDEYDEGYEKILKRRDEEVLAWERKKNEARQRHLEGLIAKMERSISPQSDGNNSIRSESPLTSLGTTPETEEWWLNKHTKKDHSDIQPELITKSRTSKSESENHTSVTGSTILAPLKNPQGEGTKIVKRQPPKDDDNDMSKIPDAVESPHKIGEEGGSVSGVDADKNMTRNLTPNVRKQKRTWKKQEEIREGTLEEVILTDTSQQKQSPRMACTKEANPPYPVQTVETMRSNTTSNQPGEASEDKSPRLFLSPNPRRVENGTNSSEHQTSPRIVHPDKARRGKSHSGGNASSDGPSGANDNSATGTDKGPRKRSASVGIAESERVESQGKKQKNLLGIRQFLKNPGSTRGRAVRVVKPKKKPSY